MLRFLSWLYQIMECSDQPAPSIKINTSLNPVPHGYEQDDCTTPTSPTPWLETIA